MIYCYAIQYHDAALRDCAGSGLSLTLPQEKQDKRVCSSGVLESVRAPARRLARGQAPATEGVPAQAQAAATETASAPVGNKILYTTTTTTTIQNTCFTSYIKMYTLIHYLYYT